MSASVRSWVPVISDELFRKYSYLEFYTFDGGGGFVNRALLGSVKSDEITDLVINQGKLEQFGTLPLLDFRRFERWRTIEKSCWINRCYFLPPLAQNAWLTGDRKLAELVKIPFCTFWPNALRRRMSWRTGSGFCTAWSTITTARLMRNLNWMKLMWSMSGTTFRWRHG